MATQELTSVGRRGPELRKTWQRRSSTQQGGKTRVHGTRGGIRAHLDNKTRPGTAEHVTASEPISTGRCVPKLQRDSA
jgi:hypothetical protein